MFETSAIWPRQVAQKSQLVYTCDFYRELEHDKNCSEKYDKIARKIGCVNRSLYTMAKRGNLKQIFLSNKTTQHDAETSLKPPTFKRTNHFTNAPPLGVLLIKAEQFKGNLIANGHDTLSDKASHL